MLGLLRDGTYTSMSIHLCPTPECQRSHREQDIYSYRKADDPPTLTRLETPDPEVMVDAMRGYFAGLWGCPLEAIELVWDMRIEDSVTHEMRPWPSYKLAKGWHMTEIVEHPSENITTYARRAVRDDS